MFGPTQLPSLRWQAGYRIGRKGAKVTRTFDTYGEARDWAEAAEHDARAAITSTTTTYLASRAVPDDTLTVSDVGAIWLALKSSKAKATRDGYACHLRAIASTGLGEQPMATVTFTQVQRWVNSQDAAGVGRPTINARLKVLRMVYAYAVADTLVGHNPASQVELLATDIRQDGNLASEQVQALLDHAGSDSLAAMVLLATDCGLRWQEVAGLPASAVVGDYLVVRQVVERSTGSVRLYTKSKAPRVVPIPTARLAELLAPLVAAAVATGDPDALLFSNGAGRCLDYWDWRRDAWRPLLRRARLNPRPRFHDLRHTYGSTLAGRNVPIAEIQKLMGHASSSTTERYIHAGSDGRRLALVREALAG